MSSYYVTVEQVQTWNLTIDAMSGAEAEEIAVNERLFSEPDTEDVSIVVCDEVKKGTYDEI
jgi:hypothetical protein